jgi:ketosteroid isomerase-like protein
MNNIDTVKQIYEAFGRGDIPAIIDKLDPNVKWDVEVSTPGVPWLQPRRGAANIPAFFREPGAPFVPALRAAHVLREWQQGFRAGRVRCNAHRERQTIHISL